MHVKSKNDLTNGQAERKVLCLTENNVIPIDTKFQSLLEKEKIIQRGSDCKNCPKRVEFNCNFFPATTYHEELLS